MSDREEIERIGCYSRSGERVFEIVVPPGADVPAQVRVILDGDEAQRLGFRNVGDAERAGRLDMIRAFRLDPAAPRCYREQPDGRDTIPDGRPIARRRDTTGWPQLAALADRMETEADLGRTFTPTALLMAAGIVDGKAKGLSLYDNAMRVRRMVLETGIAEGLRPIDVLDELDSAAKAATLWEAHEKTRCAASD